MPSDTRLLKLDSVGRVQTPAEKRAEILAEFDRSGASGVEFARHIGVKYPTFAGWLRGLPERHRPACRRTSSDRYLRPRETPGWWRGNSAWPQRAQEGADHRCFGIRGKPQPHPARRNNLKPRGWGWCCQPCRRGDRLRIPFPRRRRLGKPSNPPSHRQRVDTVLPRKLSLRHTCPVVLTRSPIIDNHPRTPRRNLVR